MMYLLVIWRSIFHKPLMSVLSLAITAASVAITLLVVMLSSGVHNALIKATEPFAIIVGSKGSPNQLVLNTVFLQDVPLGNMDYAEVEKLMSNSAVAEVVPLGFGDNYRGYRIIGSDERIFQHKLNPAEGNWLQIAEGLAFYGGHEAVIGSKVAKEDGLKLGDTFQSSHGITHGKAANEHAERFTVVGILEPLNGPYDSALIVPLTDLWEMHHDHSSKENEVSDDHDKHGGVTAILVKPKGYAEALSLYTQYKNNQNVQLIFPAQTIINLFAMLGEGEKVLQIISWSVFLLAMLVIALALYWSALQRVRERAVLRAIGAKQRDILLLIFGEGISLVVTGLVLGISSAWCIFALLAGYMEKKTALSLSASFGIAELSILGCLLIIGVLFSVIPAVRMPKDDIAKEL